MLKSASKTVHVNADNGSYDIYVGSGLLSDVAPAIKSMEYEHCVVISDDNVFRLYGEVLLADLKNEGVRNSAYFFPHGESSKNLTQLGQIYDFLYDAKTTRKSLIIALGGGVVGDIAGYAASSYLRGVDFVQIPTSILAQVDSSVGGKVAVDLKQGKNLVGSFYQPKAVFIDVDTLKTLPDREFSSGVAELIKHGFILDSSLLDVLPKDKYDKDALIDSVAKSCQIKATIVQKDPYDLGERMLLNFGHTLGHAVETLSGYGTLTHGEAVAFGMLEATKWGEALGITPPEVHAVVKSALAQYSLPPNISEVAMDEILSTIGGDKKSENDNINIVLLNSIGNARYKPIKKTDFEVMLSSIKIDWSIDES